MFSTGQESLDFHMVIEILLKLAEVDSWLLPLNASLYLFILVVNPLKLSLSGYKMKWLWWLYSFTCTTNRRRLLVAQFGNCIRTGALIWRLI
jgi:hypothetical protein